MSHPSSPHSRSFVHEPIAVIGMACRFPQAPDLAAFWDLLDTGRSAIGPVPASRWQWPQVQARHPGVDAQRYTEQAALLDDLDQFDAAFFGLSEAEAARMDPQQRLALEVCWLALENAAIVPRSLAGSHTAVIFGVGHAEQATRLKADAPSYDGRLGPHSYECFVANRVSYALNLKGPSYTINAACASSLVALHQACQALRTGDADLVLCGGVNAHLLADETVSSALAGWLSGDQRLRSFHRDGSGFVRGEGAGAVVLKRLDEARRDGDPVLGVLRGSAVGHNGLSNGISSPFGPAQAAVMRRALASAGLPAAAVSHLEAHATGSGVSDVIEATAFTEVLGQGRSEQQPLHVGAIKPCIGHLEAASGVAGLIKLLLCLQHGRLPAIAGLDAPHPDLPHHPAVRYLSGATAWPSRADAPRVAGLSNFSFGGTNAFLLVGDDPDELPSAALPETSADAGPVFLRLCARTPQALQRTRTRLREDAALISDGLHSLNVGRSVFAHRLGFVAPDLPALTALLRGAGPPADVLSSADLPPGMAGAKRLLWLTDAPPGAACAQVFETLPQWPVTAGLVQAWLAAGGLPAPQDATDAGLRNRWLMGFWAYACHAVGLSPARVAVNLASAPVAALALGLAAPVALAEWIQRGTPCEALSDPRVLVLGPQADLRPGLDARVRLVVQWGAVSGAVSDACGGSNRLATDVGFDAATGAPADWRLGVLRVWLGAFCAGADLHWARLSQGRRVGVYTDPFKRQHSWFEATPTPTAAPNAVSPVQGAAAPVPSPRGPARPMADVEQGALS